MDSSIVQQTDPHLFRFSTFSECDTPSAPPLIHNAGKATNSVNAAVYVSLFSGASSITTLQRSATVLQLWQRCHRQDDGSTGSYSLGDDSPPYSELSDNSLGLSLPVGEQSLEYAAGAAFGNALLVLLLGGLLHVTFLSQKRLMSHSNFGRKKSKEVVSKLRVPKGVHPL
ncbi:transmembrane protein, putative [Bodo saltans]|uniref:Transmembrane protein, putative n=1 Tax=Bodo saltans TaxID=75058 RepID=A0A0S4J3K7_BODSA|nr:transmembrane protein, putative [Bodo saltans]|eukprot:CUG69596.1 transmembrane protein, putative [Bodo saltans]